MARVATSAEGQKNMLNQKHAQSEITYRTVLPLPMCISNDRRNKTRNTTKSSFAMPAAATAMPVNPSTPATNATTRNTSAQ